MRAAGTEDVCDVLWGNGNEAVLSIQGKVFADVEILIIR